MTIHLIRVELTLAPISASIRRLLEALQIGQGDLLQTCPPGAPCQVISCRRREALVLEKANVYDGIAAAVEGKAAIIVVEF